MFYQKKDFPKADKVFAQMLATEPNHADAWHMRGVCFMSMKRFDKAEIFIRHALKLRREAAFYTNLGIVLVSAKKNGEEAIAAYRESLRLDPNNAKACSNLGNLLKEKWELQEAEALYRKAIELEPNYALALSNLGSLLMDRRQYEEAEAVLRKSLALNPAIIATTKTLGMLLEKNKQRTAEAAPLFKTAGEWGRLAGNLRMRAAWHDLAQVDATFISELQSGRGRVTSPWPLLNIPAMSPQLHLKAALDFANDEIGELSQRPPLVDSVARNGPLRIGYLSADYYDHATMHLLADVLEAHDPGKVEVHLLSVNPRPVKDGDPYAQRLAAMPATFHDLSSASDAQAAERIAAIAPHLLIDLKGYTTDARIGITARRPAPVIVNWLGYPGTLGHERMADYIIGDGVVTPPGHAADFSETLALMPHSYQPNDRWRPLDPAPNRSEAGLPETGFVFCSFNQFLKINSQTFDVWCRLLAAIPGSVLWLLAEHEEGMVNLRREAEQRGIAADRLVFAPRKPRMEHLARLQLADLGLDTFPCNSHTTASDALRAGVPLATRIGQTFAGRVAASLLTAHGFPELIAPDDDQAYFDLVLSLASEPEKLRHLRQQLRAAVQSSPLFDPARFARDLERLYEAMWQQQGIPRAEQMPIVLTPAKHGENGNNTEKDC
jgi:predicted O-linked N-acetylglucosamine transferase (SPINDLY family)